MRVVVLLCLFACKDQVRTELPKVGSASAIAIDAEPQAGGLRLPKLAGTPPVKTTKPIDAAKLKLEFESFTREIRIADDRGLDARYTTKERPTILVSVNASKCFDCPPMEEGKWKAKSDALRYVIGPELKDHRDTTWEMGMTAPYAWTYHVAFDGNAYSTAYAVYYNDGVNMIRVVAEYKDDVPKSREAMLATTPKQDLERIAKAFIDAFVHAW